MKRLLSALPLLLFAVTAYAQDVDFGAFADPGALLGPTAAAARRAAPRVAAPAPPDRRVRLRGALAKAEAPLSKEQEAELNKLLDAEIPSMRRTLQSHGQQMMAARGASAPATPAPPAPPPPPPAPPTGATPN